MIRRYNFKTPITLYYHTKIIGCTLLYFFLGSVWYLHAQPAAEYVSAQALPLTDYSYQTEKYSCQFHTQGWKISWRTQKQNHRSLLPTPLRYTFLDSSPLTTIQNVYGRTILYKELYPFVDLRVSLNQTLKYDLILYPGGTLSEVVLEIQGGRLLRVEQNRIVLQTSYGLIEEHIPLSYQVIEGDTVYREVRYIRKGEHTLGFQAESYDPNYALIVDPELVAASLTGSTSDQWGNSSASDAEGNIYVGGSIFGPSTGSYTPTTGAFQSTFGGGNTTDMSITKFNPTGTDMLYFTYLGGDDRDTPLSLIVEESSNELIVYGITNSNNFPATALAYDKVYNGQTDIALSRLNALGTSLLASTYIGGSGSDGNLKNVNNLFSGPSAYDYLRAEVTVDREGDIVFVTSTQSSDFPVTTGTYQGESDGIICKVHQDLEDMEWAYYIGGGEADALFSIDTTASGYYVAGATVSDDLPIPTSSYQGSKMDGFASMGEPQNFIDGFIVHVRRDNQNINYGTYIGTDTFDQAYFVRVDSKGDVHVLGQTWSEDYPVKAPTGATNIYSNPGGKIFLHKFNATLTESIWSAVVGSGGQRPDIEPTAFLVSACDQIYLSGWGGHTATGVVTLPGTLSLPVTPDAHQPTTDGSDFYLMVLAQDAASLSYASFFGAKNVHEHVDGGTSRFSKDGTVYQSICFCHSSLELPATPNAWSSVVGSGDCNQGFFKFALAPKEVQFSTNNQEDTDPGISSGCVPLTIVFKNESTGDITQSKWDFGDGTFRKNGDRNITYTFTEPGTFKVRLKVSGTDLDCTLDKDVIVEKSIQVYDDTVSVSEDLLICEGEEVQLYASGGTTYAWTPKESLKGEATSHPTIDSLGTSTEYTVDITTPNGCKKTEAVLVSVQPKISVELDIQPTDGGCDGSKSFQINSFISPTPEHLLWKMGDGNSFENVSEVNYTYEGTGIYTLEIEARDQVCYTRLTKQLSTNVLFVPNVITPNEDGKNDYLEIESVAGIHLKLFDRNGALVYSNDNYQNNWNGSGVPAGVYYYAIETDTQDLCKGWLHLIK